MNTLDSTIANVALPHIQGSLSASPDEIGWVLTSYIVAGAMMTPVSGWITTVIGAKKTLLLSVAGFTLASMLCGVASSLPELVLARIAQGAFGAFAIPLSQSVLLNINPPERHAQAMALWATGTVLGPIFGPVVGGYLTEQASWRWCFYINVPLGILTLALAWLFMSSDGRAQPRRFDGLGFSALIIAVACVQLVVDRGPGQDWYSSAEIWTETIIGLAAVWVFIIHTLTTEHPFIDRSLMRDSNLVGATLFGFFAGTLMFGSMAILPIMMQSLMGYPVMTAGIISMPRGLGTLASLVLLPHLAARLGMRAMLLLGLLTTGCAYWQMMHFDLSMGPQPLIVSGIVQGLGQAFVLRAAHDSRLCHCGSAHAGGSVRNVQPGAHAGHEHRHLTHAGAGRAQFAAGSRLYGRPSDPERRGGSRHGVAPLPRRRRGARGFRRRDLTPGEHDRLPRRLPRAVRAHGGVRADGVSAAQPEAGEGRPRPHRRRLARLQAWPTTCWACSLRAA